MAGSKGHDNTPGAWQWIDSKFGNVDFGDEDVQGIIGKIRSAPIVNDNMKKFLDSDKPGVTGPIDDARSIQTRLTDMDSTDAKSVIKEINELDRDIFKTTMKRQARDKVREIAKSISEKIGSADSSKLSEIESDIVGMPDTEVSVLRGEIQSRRDTIYREEQELARRGVETLEDIIKKIDTAGSIKDISGLRKSVDVLPPEIKQRAKKELKKQDREIRMKGISELRAVRMEAEERIRKASSSVDVDDIVSDILNRPVWGKSGVGNKGPVKERITFLAENKKRQVS